MNVFCRCWTENLAAAPSVRLGCGHVFHFACIKEVCCLCSKFFSPKYSCMLYTICLIFLFSSCSGDAGLGLELPLILQSVRSVNNGWITTCWHCCWTQFTACMISLVARYDLMGHMCVIREHLMNNNQSVFPFFPRSR